MSPQRRLRDVGYHQRKKNQLLELIRNLVVGQCFCSIGVLNVMVVNQEQVPVPLHSTKSTEPIVIPERAK